MSANLSKETAMHAKRWTGYQLGDLDERPMEWAQFCDGLERQRDDARSSGGHYIKESSRLEAEALGYRETIKALEEKLALSQEAVRIFDTKLAQVESQLAAKDGYWQEDIGGPMAVAAPPMELRDWLAGMALQGILSNPNVNPGEVGDEWVRVLSRFFGDSLLAAHNGKDGA